MPYVRHSLCQFILVFIFALSDANTECDGQNSTEKIRTTPSKQAQRIGSAVKWVGSFEKARQLSTKNGKPIFWYVPTVENSFMDRKVEIDRYMRAGLFSWPYIVDRLNNDFVPLIAVPNSDQSRQFDLVPFKFIEPGFLVIDAKGKTTLRCNRLTTQHPVWFDQLLNSVVPARKNDVLASHTDSILDAAWTYFRVGKYQQALDHLVYVHMMSTIGRRGLTEPDLLRGMCLFRMGMHHKAREIWKSLGKRFPDEPLAQKAAAEAEGFGPFVRGFEVHTALPDSAYNNVDLQNITSTAPAGTFSEEDVWKRGTQFLLGMQRSDGGFVDCDYDFGGTDSLPNVHVAVTAICAMALIESAERNDDLPRAKIDNAIKTARDFVLNDRNWNRRDSDELFWAHAYRVMLLASSIKNEWEGEAELQTSVDQLQAMQLSSGSWYHEYPNPLVTSLALVAMKKAELAGATIDNKRVARAMKALERNRGRGGFYYSDEATGPQQIKAQDLTDASAGRLPLCELALHLWDASKDRQLAKAVETSINNQSHLFASLKYDDHTSRHDYGGFFFWFDIHGRSEAVRSLKNPKLKAKHQQLLKKLVLRLPEIDGCFVDSHEIGRCYGTAMALLTLANADK